MGKIKYFIILFSVFFIFLFISCDSIRNKQDELELQGYEFIENENWYEKKDENNKSLIINLTKSDAALVRSYSIVSSLNEIIFIGQPDTIYTDFNIVVNGRNQDLTIQLCNFNYKASNNKIGLDLTNIIGTQKVKLIVKGISSISGGKGNNGYNGMSYDYNSAVKDSKAQNGEEGKSGVTGSEAISVNNLVINIENNSKLSLYGGSGGNGGDALKYDGHLEINNNGEFFILGGTGGHGGNGGHGGENKDTSTFDIADHGGNGGDGGHGGIGGYAIISDSTNSSINIIGSDIIVQPGAGGNGGNGGIGGSSCRNEFQSGNGGIPGNGGNGGDGGDCNSPLLNCNFICIFLSNKGGFGGKKGSPGYNPSRGYGKSGNNGIDGKGYN